MKNFILNHGTVKYENVKYKLSTTKVMVKRFCDDLNGYSMRQFHDNLF